MRLRPGANRGAGRRGRGMSSRAVRAGRCHGLAVLLHNRLLLLHGWRRVGRGHVLRVFLVVIPLEEVTESPKQSAARFLLLLIGCRLLLCLQLFLILGHNGRVVLILRLNLSKGAHSQSDQSEDTHPKYTRQSFETEHRFIFLIKPELKSRIICNRFPAAFCDRAVTPERR